MQHLRLPREVEECLHQFQAIQREILKIKDESARGVIGTIGENRLSSEEIAREAFSALRGTLTSLGAEPVVEGRSLTKVTRGYILASYADEAMMHLVDWPGAPHWSKFLLERNLFRSRLSGERILDTAEELVARRDVGSRDLAMLIYLAIACGFQGRTRGFDDAQQLRQLKRDLYNLAVGRNPPSGIQWQNILATAHANTILQEAPILGRGAERWRLIFVLILIGYIGVSQAIWHHNYSDIADLAREVNASQNAIAEER